MTQKQFTLKLSCQDQLGIVAAVAGHLAENGFSIIESSQHEDPYSNLFFMRTEFTNPDEPVAIETIRQRFAELADRFSMQWSIHDQAIKPRVLIAVSQWEHCLNSILGPVNTE